MKSSISVLMIVLGVFVNSCKKDDDTDQAAPVPQNYICTGKGSDSYLPLAINNSWTYPDFMNSVILNIFATIDYDSATYFKITPSSGAAFYSLRVTGNGDIVIFNTATWSDELYIPNAPVYLQSWSTSGGLIKKVTDTSIPITTGSCTYDDCLKISLYDASGTLYFDYFYKRGIGLVRQTQYILGNPYNFDLTSLTLN